MKQRVPITNEERELVFEIVSGVPQLIYTIGQIRIIAIDAKDVGYMDILRYFKKQKLTGWNLVQWLKEKQDGSLLQAIAFVRQRVHSDFGIRKIYAKGGTQ